MDSKKLIDALRIEASIIRPDDCEEARAEIRLLNAAADKIADQQAIIGQLVNFIEYEIDQTKAFLVLDDEAQKLNSEGFILRCQAALAAAEKLKGEL